ncbi:Zn-ribbon domain-containing OB-fold protein [Rhizomonospora bruguierae]|uniref:Zn-ribbon domain-containing OB-fold protein n=1 Tax=Rhizomonospora bruguierae TaxID=1581705 RepID=UPI001BD0AC20|nr:OB-fold domain-containing protein [Micromonospora sp. NBRC 107566]
MTIVDDAAYWQRCAAGEFALQRCASCRTWRYPPSPLCPNCLGREFAWELPSGRGTVWSWIRMHQRYFPADAFDLPYEVAFVELDEGPFMIAGFAAGTAAPPPIGTRVAVVFQSNKRGDQQLPVFRSIEVNQ